MYTENRGLGFFQIIPLLIAAGASIGGSAAAAAISKPRQATQAEILEYQAKEQKAEKEKVILIIAGGVLLTFILMAMRR